MIKGYFSVLLLLALFNITIAQSDWRISVPVSIDGGLQLPKVSGDSSSTWTTAFTKSIHLRSGISFIYKKRLGILLEGGLLIHNSDFRSKNAVYSVSSILTSVNCSPFLLFPFKKNLQTNFHLGSGLGYSFIGNDQLFKTGNGFQAVSSSFAARPFTIAPEIGISRIEKKIIVSFMATYNYQFGVDKIVSTTISDANGKFVSSIKGDYFGFKIRMEFKLNKEKVYPSIYKPSPPENEEFAKRSVIVARSFSTRKEVVLLELFEKNKVDYDSISVSVNGKYILINHALTTEKVSIRIPLEKGKNIITVYALNEGDIPPNTATCILHFGRRTEEFMVQTGKRKNAVIEIERK